MRLFPFLALIALATTSTRAQEGLQPEFDIPSTIAKVPERSDFLGPWTRGDGGYRMEIEANADSPGGLIARYFNPAPIHVEQATLDEEAGDLILTIVLRDEGYPGSTYRLRFLAERQALVGIYARPEAPPSEVYFVRQAPTP